MHRIENEHTITAACHSCNNQMQHENKLLTSNALIFSVSISINRSEFDSNQFVTLLRDEI